MKDIYEKMNRAGGEGKPFLFGIDFEQKESFFIEDPLESKELLFNVNGTTNAASEEPECLEEPRLTVLSSDRKHYEEGFGIVRSGILRGDSFLLNLTARTEVRTNLSLRDIFCRSTAPYRLYWPGRFVCFSPESFVRIEGRRISTYPMKGTIDAALPDARQRLMDDYKESCEHYTIVDLMRNDLNRVAEQVRVDRFRYVDRIKTLQGEILQTSSEVSGLLPEDWTGHVGDLFRSLLPAGSISGAPKAATCRLIKEAEGMDRGFYTGVFGYFDGKNLDSAVLIRFIEEDGSRTYFRSGGGVTVNSRCEEEYREILEKVYLSFK